MTNQDILNTAMQQSAFDCCCNKEDFMSDKNVVVASQNNKAARKYLTLPFDCHLVSYGSNIVASVSPDLADLVERYINCYPVEHCFETPGLHVLDDQLQQRGLRICFMAEYFLPDVNRLRELSCGYVIKQLTRADFGGLYVEEWSNALCDKRKELDILGVGAYDGDKLIGLAGASADCGTMWQIGIDVLPQYRRQGIAGALTARLALEIQNRGKVPFYCAAWSNLKSVRNALRAGFYPAWVEVTAKSCEFVAQINGLGSNTVKAEGK